MSDIKIHVDPVSIRAYGTKANETFHGIRQSLQSLAQDVAAVPYNGPNAFELKTTCAAMASEFARALTADLQLMAEAVSGSTSNIASALGGTAITLAVNGDAIAEPPIPADDGTLGADPAALTELAEAVRGHCNNIASALELHKTQLAETSWNGNAKEQAMQAVGTFTISATAKVEEARSKITTYLTDQVTNLQSADA